MKNAGKTLGIVLLLAGIGAVVYGTWKYLKPSDIKTDEDKGDGNTTTIDTGTPGKPPPNVKVITSGFKIGDKLFAKGAGIGANVYSNTSPGKNSLVGHFKPYYPVGTFLAMRNGMIKIASEIGPFLEDQEVYAMQGDVFATK